MLLPLRQPLKSSLLPLGLPMLAPLPLLLLTLLLLLKPLLLLTSQMATLGHPRPSRALPGPPRAPLGPPGPGPHWALSMAYCHCQWPLPMVWG